MAIEESNDTQKIILINPIRCRVWRLHERMDDFLTPTACRDLLSSLQKGDQISPAIVRQVSDEPGIDFELICGARRLFVARYLGTTLRAIMKNVDDRAAICLMLDENIVRSDVSPYERGIALSRWLKAKVFPSQAALARATRLSEATISRLLTFSTLPAAVLEAFGDPRQIKEEWSVEITQLCKTDKSRARTLNRARLLAKQKLAPQEVFMQLIAPERSERRGVQEFIIRDATRGTPLFRLRQSPRTFSLVFRRPPADMQTINRIVDVVRNTLIVENSIPEVGQDINSRVV